MNQYRAYKKRFAKKLLERMTSSERYFLDFCKHNGVFPDPQWPVGKYILDFRFPAHVALEIDGGYHKKRTEYDRKRDKKLNEKGWQVVRVSNEEAMTQPIEVLRKIYKAMKLNGCQSASSFDGLFQ
jgi:very-short-patch-repair endonuclease